MTNAKPRDGTGGGNATDGRRRWMSVLAKADAAALDALWQALDGKPAWTTVRPAEVGMVMVRARAGGTGNQFNAGEMTVTRCAVQIAGGALGLGYVAGRDKRHAEIAAVLDGLLQDDALRDRIDAAVIRPLERGHDERRRARSLKSAATKVDFFTVVRGS